MNESSAGKENIYGIPPEGLRRWFTVHSEKPSKADRLLPALYRELKDSLDDMSFKKELSDKLAAEFYTALPECIDIRTSDTADKYLFRFSDGCTAEAVHMKHRYGNTVCVSSQSGCNMGCIFCASGKLRKQRDLTAAEMVGQVLYIHKNSAPVNGISVMGIGEPLENLDALLPFLDIMKYQNGLSIAPRHITVSTCGLVPEIYELAESGRRINLAVSLHAPTDELRSRLMPINKRYPISELIKAAKDYSLSLNRRVTVEYIMLDGINDSDECALRLAELISGSKLYVNMIRYNSSPGGKLRCSSDDAILRFYDILKKKGINVTVRMSMGADINGACGQLRADREKQLMSGC